MPNDKPTDKPAEKPAAKEAAVCTCKPNETDAYPFALSTTMYANCPLHPRVWPIERPT